MRALLVLLVALPPSIGFAATPAVRAAQGVTGIPVDSGAPDPEEGDVPDSIPADLEIGEEDRDLTSFGVDGPEELPNFHPVAPGIWRSGQPNRRGLARLAQDGVRTVLSLRFWVGKDERREVRRLAMRSEHVGMNGFFSPTFGQVDRALDILEDPARLPILAHCRYGKDRTGAVIAAYRVAVQDWSPREAAVEAKMYGCCTPYFDDLEGWLERYKAHRQGARPPASRPGAVLPPAADSASRSRPAPGGPASALFDGSR